MGTPPAFSPVRSVRLYERIVEQIEQAIDEGRLRPGERLPSERELVTQLGASRATVREALRVLQSAGVLESRPGDPLGPRVVTPGPAHLRKQLSRLAGAGAMSLAEVLAARMVLDGAACRLAARLRTAEQLAAIEDAVADMERRVEQGHAAFSEADVRFHDAVAAASGNLLVQVGTAAVREVVLRLVRERIDEAGGHSPTRARALMRRSLAHHREVLDAIRAGDGERAARDATRSLYAYYGGHLDAAGRRSVRALLDEPAPRALRT
ncbi:FadR/GntR family transcriptional regulator [Lapillicoccus jejuensis]|uniref:DNA-binding FadR family transcriptional regulator n=1 Tax=Lapillicoccus jejuensis TaxID=402171 RepID=A0A542E6U9_9MICO|nr:FadR/GntR family transcriptional regulator [Lapillicoccus jejuensis]TQJ11065.1 DNA-binding FadR family transcriptional regulator [Lapillicoccus jejuensis]